VTAAGRRDLAALPKGHLHVHLEGAMRPETLAELAAGYGIDVPPIRGYGSFPAFAGMYLAACEVLRTPEDLARVVTEVVEDSAADGAVWVEPSFYAPHHRGKFSPLTGSGSGSAEDDIAAIEIVLAAGHSAAARLGVGFGLMIATDRTADPAMAVDIARMASKFAGLGAVSFGLANDEGPFPPEPFAQAFAIAKDAGFLSTPHAGELAGPASVRGALEALGADRLQHGVRAMEDPELVRRLADSDICLDVCPTSNLMLSVVPSLAEHPLKALIEAGVNCSLNGDDPLLFGPGLLAEYELSRDELGLSDEQLAFVARCSLQASGAPQPVKDAGVGAIDTWLAGPCG
jgi:adenosine deaminase